MDFDRGHASPHRWSQVRRLELCSGIRSLEDYEQAVSTGNLNAIAFLREVDTLHGLRIGDVRHVHYLTFEQVHPWAGQFRRPGQLVTVSGFPAADPPRIKREVSLALVQTEELFDEARTEEDGLRWLAALAFSTSGSSGFIRFLMETAGLAGFCWLRNSRLSLGSALRSQIRRTIVALCRPLLEIIWRL